MSSSSVPLDTAVTIFNISIVVLVGGILLVLISTVSLVWSGMIKEQYANEKIAHDEAAAAEAKAAAVKAKADAEEARKKLAAAEAQAKADAAAAKAEQERQKAMAGGRAISPEDRAKFKEFVKSFSKGRVFIGSISGDPEAASYASQIGSMLTDSGYLVVPKTDLMLPPEEHVSGVHVRIRSLAEQPTYAGSLQKGLEIIDINTAGELDEAASDSVLILVGNKP